MKQSFIISTTSIMRINMRLIKASQFLRQFDFNIKYKFDKEHILFDTLSKLININIDISISKDHFEFDILFIIILI